MQHRDVLPSGTVLDGKYRIDHLIGAGGFGMTYAAHDLGLNLPVAVKEYYPAQFGMREGTLTVRPVTDRDRDLFDRLKDSFLREARTLAQLRHPAIVRVLSVFEGHGTAYMIMELERGKSLRGWLDGLDRPPTQAELDAIAGPLLDALEAMHAQSFLHRDIAPDNIIVRENGSPVLLDFGAARRVMAELSGALTGIVKQGYSPQEQYANDPRAQGPWSDIYALGATLYRCVTGRTPDEATLRMLGDPMQPAATAATGTYRPAFLAAIDRAMALRPSDRPQSVAELRTLLMAAPTVAIAAPASAAAPAATGGWSRVGTPPAPGDAKRRSPGWRVAMGALAIVALGGMGWTMYRFSVRSEGPQPPRQPLVQPVAEAPGNSQSVLGKAKQEAAEAEQRRLAEQQRQAEAQRQAEQQRQAEAQRAAAEQVRRAQAEREAQAAAERQRAAAQEARNAAFSGLQKRLEDALGPCPFCDDVKKILSPDDFAELQWIPEKVARTVAEVRNRRGPREDAIAGDILKRIANAELDPDPLAAVKTGRVKCTTYNFGFLDNAAERVGGHQCDVRMVRIGGNLASLTISKVTGEGFFADIKPYRANAMAYVGRTFLPGHAIRRYNAATPRNRENDNYGNKVGLLVAIAGKPALLTINQNGFTEADPTFFEVTILE